MDVGQDKEKSNTTMYFNFITMDNKQALTILTEMQKWRRAQPPYDYDGDDPMKYRGIPYTPEEFGKAIDHAIVTLSNIEGD